MEVNKNAKRTRPIYSHLDQTGLVNKAFIKWPKRKDVRTGVIIQYIQAKIKIKIFGILRYVSF